MFDIIEGSKILGGGGEGGSEVAINAQELRERISVEAYFKYCQRLDGSLRYRRLDRAAIRYQLYRELARWPTEFEVAERAQEWHNRRVHGHDLEDWLEAEFQMCARYPVRFPDGRVLYVARCPDLEDRGTFYFFNLSLALPISWGGD